MGLVTAAPCRPGAADTARRRSIRQAVLLLARSARRGGSSTRAWPRPPPGSPSTALGLSPRTALGSTVEFFLYEAPKVLLLLTLVVFGVGIVRSFFTPERTRRILAGKREAIGNVLAALLGRRDAVLLLLGGAALHRLRHDRRAARRDVLVPRLGADGERGRARPALRPVRLEGRGALPGHGPRRSRSSRASSSAGCSSRAGSSPGCTGCKRGAGGLEDERVRWADRLAAGREAVRDIVGKVWPYVVGRHRGRRRHPRLRAAGLHGVHHGEGRLVVGAARRR